jgi:acetylornithine deacetylase/succinyl-diaminopimelate desuccinylase-like protein
VSAARRHLERIAAAPRPAGSGAEREARAYCAAVLRELGFSVREEPFEYSTVPGRLGTPWSGAASILLLAAAGHLGWRGEASDALAVLVVGGAVVAGGAVWLARRGVLALPWWRRRGTNLVAVRGTPSVWLMAHLDSKSQPVPIMVRALGVMAMLLVWALALAVALAQRGGAPLAWAWPWLSAAGLVAGAPVAASVVRARSPGALDDASGVAAVLHAAAELPAPARARVGIVLTSAEELGLAGARAWVRGREQARAINVDGVDDSGDLRVTYSARRPQRLVDCVLAAARACGVPARAARLVPGVLVDGVALADTGWDVVTISRGTWRTVARIHTPRDDLARLGGDGVAKVAQVVARSVAELR